MASKLLGRCTCPLCDDDKAHVKIKTDKAEGATAYPYLHCRECGFQGHTKNRHQAELLLKKTRPEKIDPAAAPEPAPVEKPAPVDTTPAAQQKTPQNAQKPSYGGRFGRAA